MNRIPHEEAPIDPPPGGGSGAAPGGRPARLLPRFVVVGNVNQGKSSIVAALTEDSAVPIASYPGTTSQTGEYTFRLGEVDLFTIIDTPGFQEARAALAWMKARAASPAERPKAVRDFVDAHQEGVGDGRFTDEVRLLKPIVAGASVIYVVDASSRFEPANEAEMEILRWTGQPAMALINRTRERDHGVEWRPVLEQFFNLVREFDAHDARFSDRLDLLSGFKEVRSEWRQPIDRAIAAMQHAWLARRRKSAQVIAELLIDALGHVEKRGIAGEDPPPGLAEELEQAYQDSQRRIEQRARKEIETLYHHRDIENADPVIALHESDLFSETSWRVFGLTRKQLASYGLAWGALLGGTIDVAVGGASFLTGLVGGAMVGGLGGFFATRQVAKTLPSDSRLARALFAGATGRFLFKGPVTNPRYAWVLLDRALCHWLAIRDRSHARRDRLAFGGSSASARRASNGAGGGAGGGGGDRGEGEGEGGQDAQALVATLDAPLRDQVDRDLRQLFKQALSGAVTAETRERLATHLDAVLTDLAGA